MRLVLAIILFIIIFVIAVAVIGFCIATRHWQRTKSPQQVYLRNLWLNVGLMILMTVLSWDSVLTAFSAWPALFVAAVSAMGVLMLLAAITNWHGWGQRLARRLKPPHRQPRNPQLRRTVLIAAPLALLSDVVLLILIIVR